MNLPVKGGEIGKNPFIGHAHPLDQDSLVEKVQLTQQGDQVVNDSVHLHQDDGVKGFQDLAESAVAEGGGDDRQHVIAQADGGLGGGGTGAHGRDPRHELHPDLGVPLQNGRIQIIASGIDSGIAEGGEGHIPALAENGKDFVGGILPGLQNLRVRFLAQVDLFHGKVELHNLLPVNLARRQRLPDDGKRCGMAVLRGLGGRHHRTAAQDIQGLEGQEVWITRADTDNRECCLHNRIQ